MTDWNGESFCRANCRVTIQNGIQCILKLCNIIRPQVQIDDEMSRCRTLNGPITFDIMLHFTVVRKWKLTWQKLCTGISPAAFYCWIYKCIDTILKSEELSHNSPTTKDELDVAVRGLTPLSTHGPIKRCVACI